MSDDKDKSPPSQSSSDHVQLDSIVDGLETIPSPQGVSLDLVKANLDPEEAAALEEAIQQRKERRQFKQTVLDEQPPADKSHLDSGETMVTPQALADLVPSIDELVLGEAPTVGADGSASLLQDAVIPESEPDLHAIEGDDGDEETFVASYKELVEAGSIDPEKPTTSSAMTSPEMAAPKPGPFLRMEESVDLEEGDSESTAYDDPDLLAMREKALEIARQRGKQAAVGGYIPPRRPSQQEIVTAQVPDEVFRTIVDTQLSPDDIKKIVAAKKKTNPVGIQIPKASEKTKTQTVLAHRTCYCDTHTTETALNKLHEAGFLEREKGRFPFVLLSVLFAVGGCVALTRFGFTRFGQFGGVLGVVLAAVGLGIFAGSFLSIRAHDHRRGQLLLESIGIAVLSVAAVDVLLFVQAARLFDVAPSALILRDPWGMPFVRESILLFICLQIGLIGGWTFRLSEDQTLDDAGLPDYQDVLKEFVDPDMERMGRSFNDVLQRSKNQFKLYTANDLSSRDSFQCSYCFRDAHAIAQESEGCEWLSWILACPHCDSDLCIQHYADNAWQCRSCGKSIRHLIHLCADCPPGQLPEGQRALLCPYCHSWKGCKDHYKKRGWKCPSCESDVQHYAEAYGLR